MFDLMVIGRANGIFSNVARVSRRRDVHESQPAAVTRR
jgi:hypothetical protein